MSARAKQRRRKLPLLWLPYYCYFFLVMTSAKTSHGEQADEACFMGRPETRSTLEESSSFERRGRRSRKRWPMLETWQLSRESAIDGKWWEPTAAVSGLPQNVTQKVASAIRQHFHSLRKNQTTLVEDSVVALSFVTLFQVVKTTLVSPTGLVRQTISLAVPPPTRLAWEQIAQVVEVLQAEPDLRTWAQYSPHVVWQSLKAIRKLQRALPKQHFSTELVLDESKTQLIAKDLAYFSVYATLAYGWPMALARMAYGWPKWRGGGSLQTLLQQTGLTESNVIEAAWTANTHRPAYLLVQDPHQKAIVLTIRGTWSASDILTDLCCTTTEMSAPSQNDTMTALWQWLRPQRYPTLEAHHGMVQAALALQGSLHKHVEAALKENPNYRLVLVGHSMGGGCAALLGLLWEKDFNPVVYIYGPPCVAPFESPLTHHGQIHSVVLPGDPFCTLSLGHVTELAATVDYLAKHDALRRKICRRSVSSGYAAEIWNVLDENVWSKRRQKQVARQDSADDDAVSSPKLVPPGNVWRLVRQPNTRSHHHKKWRLERVSTREFLSLSIQPFAMDLTRHVPALYEACLRQSFV
eukprot:scaffold12050_cov168-Amphora_coffeaeformis.AAC.9